jgi:primosomal protein N' (replication factor Y) (superfamily II helicase)
VTNSKTNKTFAEVVFPAPVEHAYTYRIPEKFDGDVVPGVRVLAPFGPRKVTGFVVGLKESTERSDIKEIEEVLDPVPLFTPEVLELARWIAGYYICGWGEVLKAALPSGIHLNSVKIARLTHPDPERLANLLEPRAPRQAQILRLLGKTNPMALNKLAGELAAINIYSSLRKLRQDGFVRMELALPRPKVGNRYENVVQIAQAFRGEPLRKLALELAVTAPKQARVLEVLQEEPEQELSRMDLAKQTGVAVAVITSLYKKGVLTNKKILVERDYYANAKIEPPIKLVLNKDQAEALQAITKKMDAGAFCTMVLHGVTASGKTQVYIEAIDYALKKGLGAIVMVPEIALTPQMVRRFRSHFGDRVAVFHSRMSPGERYDSWRRTWEGKHQIVIGPRSAIFAPIPKVGLIVVDEEHEPSYKQNDLTPRYHARDVAVMRAKLNNAVVVLGSATPSLETYFNAQVNKYVLLSLPNRIDDVPMPGIHVVDMRREPKIIGSKDPIIFSRLLRQKIDEKIGRGEQIILFQNRRGFATLCKCTSCGYIAKCEHCDITLTFHLRNRLLKCHYCGYQRKAPDHCPECQSLDIFMRGIGTQRIEEELHSLFPGVASVRMDLDTTRGRHSHDKILTQFSQGEYQILLGTQMVAKGLDFPRVTLVGVISADSELLFPDFRSGERTFQLLTQVAGRAGRKDKEGEVVIQTYSPDHYSIFYVRSHDYEHFFKSELKDRRELDYPPYSRMINILFRGLEEKQVQQVAQQYGECLNSSLWFRMLGPVPAALSKIENQYRFQILLISSKQHDPGGQKTRETVRLAITKFKEHHRTRNIQVSIDVDPISIL